jgi:hypothetical protein
MYTTCSGIDKFWFLPIHCIYVFSINLRINRVCSAIQLWPLDLCSECAAYFLWCRGFIVKHRLDEFKDLYEYMIKQLTREYLTSKLIPWSWALLEKTAFAQLLKNFPTLFVGWMFTTVITRALHCSLSWERAIQSIPCHSISLRSTFILSSHLHLGLSCGLFPSGFLTKILYTFLQSPRVLHILSISSSISTSSQESVQVRGPSWHIVTNFSFLRWHISTTPSPQSGGPPLVGCPRLLI